MPRESRTDLEKRTLRVISSLKEHYPNATCALHHRSPEELLIATVLSAQCTDERVNQVTPKLFARFPTMQELAQAKLAEIEQLIRSTGFFRSKARALQELAKTLVDHHSGLVPADFAVLTQLRGVGRKTANVVMGNAFGKATGVVVDTHVGRLSRRLGLTRAKDPVKVEEDLRRLVPQGDWIMFSHWLIEHGRRVCRARAPACGDCFLRVICPQKIQ